MPDVARFESLLDDEALCRLALLVETGVTSQYTGPEGSWLAARDLLTRDIEHALTLLAERGEPS